LNYSKEVLVELPNFTQGLICRTLTYVSLGIITALNYTKWASEEVESMGISINMIQLGRQTETSANLLLEDCE
jgi:hypothetical protein